MQNTAINFDTVEEEDEDFIENHEYIPQEEDQDMMEHQEVVQEEEVDVTLPDMSYDNLERIKEAVLDKMQEAREKERAIDLNAVKALVAKHGFKWSDIKVKEQPKTKVAPKYRDPETGAEWSGRGRPPLWIRDVEDREPFLIENQ